MRSPRWTWQQALLLPAFVKKAKLAQWRGMASTPAALGPTCSDAVRALLVSRPPSDAFIVRLGGLDQAQMQSKMSATTQSTVTATPVMTGQKSVPCCSEDSPEPTSLDDEADSIDG